jgi:hypothetical protein
MNIASKILKALEEVGGDFTLQEKQLGVKGKKKPKSEAVEDEKYQNVIFMQGDDAIEPLKILDDKGVEDAVEYLAQWDYGEGEVIDWPAGTNDDYEEVGEYIIMWNSRLGYIGMVKKMTPEFKKRHGV